MKNHTPRLSAKEAAIVKGMLARGDLQSDIASYFRTNAGRISEINTGKRHAGIAPADVKVLPPRDPDDRRWN